MSAATARGRAHRWRAWARERAIAGPNATATATPTAAIATGISTMKGKTNTIAPQGPMS